MANSWIEALKIWNGKKGGTWCVPRKGSVEHAEIMKIMRGASPAPKKGNIKFKKAPPKKAPVKKAPKKAPKKTRKKPPNNIVIEDWGDGILPRALYIYDRPIYDAIESLVIEKITNKKPLFLNKLLPYTEKYNDVILKKYGKDILLSGIKRIVEWILQVEGYDGIPPNFIIEEAQGSGIVQLGRKAPKKKRGRPKKQSGRGNDEWVDTNVNIIGELEEAGVPVPTELSLVNTVYDTFGPKAPQVNKKTGAVRPAPGLFDFLNFEF